MSQALNAYNPNWVRWDYAPRKPFEPLLAEVAARVGELESDAGPQRLTIAEATDAVRDLAEELGDLVFNESRSATHAVLREQATDIMVAAARFIRDVCGDK